MDPDPLEAGVLLFGSNPVSVDACSAVLMGFDIDTIPIVCNAFHARGFPLADFGHRDIDCISNHANWNGSLNELVHKDDRLNARAHFGWIGHIEAVNA